MKLRRLIRASMLLAVISAAPLCPGVARAQESAGASLPELKGRAADDVKDALAETVGTVMNGGGPRGLFKMLCREDRERIGDEVRAREGEVDSRVERARETWRVRYGKAFDVDGEKDLFPDAIVTGDGRTARVTLPGGPTQASVHMRLVKEGGGWRLDVPDSMNQFLFQAAPGFSAARVELKRAAWPSDLREAYRFAAHDVLMPFAQTVNRTK